MITITSTANHVTVDMGAYYPDSTQFKRGYWRKDQILFMLENTNHVEVEAVGNNDWIFTYDGNGVGFQVIDIDGAAPTSNSDLFTKLVAVLG